MGGLQPRGSVQQRVTLCQKSHHSAAVATLGEELQLKQCFHACFLTGGDLHARRLAFARLRDDAVTKKLFEIIGPRYAERAGGYTRVLKAGYRYGDSAPMAVIELVERDEEARGQDSGPTQETVDDEVDSGAAA